MAHKQVHKQLFLEAREGKDKKKDLNTPPRCDVNIFSYDQLACVTSNEMQAIVFNALQF